MIRSFRCPDTERVARRKLRQLEIAGSLDDLRVPPGQHIICINDQFHLCFIWTVAGTDAVEIVDVH